MLILVSYTLLVTILGYYIFGRAATSTPYQSEPRGRLEAFSDTSKRPNGPAVMTFYALGDWGTADQIQKQVALLLKKNMVKI